MQHCFAFPWHAVLCLFMAAHCSAVHLEVHSLETHQGFEGSIEAEIDFTITRDVRYAKGLTNCKSGMLAAGASCSEMNLTLDVYEAPSTTQSGVLKPAILIVHGGCNIIGSKSTQDTSARFWAKHGYVAFVPDYRLKKHNGNFPGSDFDVELSPWSTLYPAVRDVKAALRFIVANAGTYGVDTSKIIALGSSAGAMNVLAAFAANNNTQFTDEFTWNQDPTLSTVHHGVNATVKAIIMKSGNSWGLQSYSQYSGVPAPWEDGGKKAVVGNLRPLMQFHGTADDIIPIENAHITAKFWNRAGAVHCLMVLEGSGHLRATHTHPVGVGSLDQMGLNFINALDASTNGTIECPKIPSAE